MRIIDTTAALEALCSELKSAPYIALDTEFLRDSTYWPKLCLLQIAAPGIEAIVDPLAEGLDLSSFFELLKIPGIVKVLHAGRQDIEIFWNLGHAIPAPLFDTQIAAMVCGFGESASYETLARKLAGVQLDKSARFTDWSRRPLTDRQLEYALGDVTHLRVVYEKLSAELTRTGRAPWVAEEISALQNEKLYILTPEDAWKRLKPRTNSKRFMAMLSAVAAWREREAQTRDMPRGRVLKDEAILEIAANPPAGAAALEAIGAGRDGPAPVSTGEFHHKRAQTEPPSANVDLLKALLRLKAEEVGVAPRLIASADEIERIAAFEDEGIAALSGWRAEVFGNDARALRNGAVGLVIRDGKVAVVRQDPA